jgi:hypothetical protein
MPRFSASPAQPLYVSLQAMAQPTREQIESIISRQMEEPTIISKDGAVGPGGSSSWVGLATESEHHNWPQMGLAMCLNSFGSHPGSYG